MSIFTQFWQLPVPKIATSPHIFPSPSSKLFPSFCATMQEKKKRRNEKRKAGQRVSPVKCCNAEYL